MTTRTSEQQLNAASPAASTGGPARKPNGAGLNRRQLLLASAAAAVIPLRVQAAPAPAKPAGDAFVDRIAFGGQLMCNPGKSVEENLAAVLERLYKPTSPAALDALVSVVRRAEGAYFNSMEWDCTF